MFSNRHGSRMSIAVASPPVCETRQGPASSAHSLAAQIYACLKNDIFDFRLLPGDRFSEGEIATRMQVSRTPVRQALFWLQRDGYVDVHFKSGWQIKAFDFKYFEDLYEVRTLMETSAVASLVGESLKSLQPLREVWCVPEEQRETDPAVVASLDEAFHTGLVAATGNQEMARIHLDITERIRIIRRLDVIKLPRVSATYDDHAAILASIEAGDAARAQSCLREHIADSRAEVKRITFYMLQTARERYGALTQMA